jgi:hypothetical protein
LRITRAVNVTLSGYDIAPWGTQTITSRVITASSPGKSGSASRGRPFENTHQTTGTATLTQDDGFSASLLVSPKSYLDLDVGYTRSEQYGLDTVSFGVGVHVTELLGKAHRPCIVGYTPECKRKSRLRSRSDLYTSATFAIQRTTICAPRLNFSRRALR